MTVQTRMARALRALIAQDPPDIERGIARGLAGLSDLLGGGRAWVFLACADGTACLAHDSSAEAAPQRIAAAPGWLGQLAQPMVAPQPATLPTIGAYLADQGAGPCLVSPMQTTDGPVGIMACEAIAPGEDIRDFAGEYAGLLAEIIRKARSGHHRAETGHRLEAILEALPDLLFEIDANGTYTGFAAGPQHLLLMQPSEFKGREIGSVMPPDVAVTVRRALREVLEHGQVNDLHFALDLPDGRHVFAANGARKAAALPGQDPGVVFLVRDVTQAHAMKEELGRLGSITRAMSNLVVIVDPDLRITWVNPAFESHTGWTLDEIRGQSLPGLVRCEESDPEVVAGVSAAIAQALPFSGQMVNKDRHGNRYHVDFNILPLRDAQGEVQGFVSIETVVTQIKEQKAALERLAQAAAMAQSRLENALNALPDGVMIFDADERLLICNPAQKAAFPEIAPLMVPGVTRRELLMHSQALGFYDAPLTAGADMPPADPMAIARGKAHHADEFQLRDGRYFRRVINRTADGGLITVAIDMTARHNQMAALDAANTQLQQALDERARAESRLHNIMDSTRVGTWELDLDLGIVTVCRQWAQIFGLNSDDCWQISHADFLDLVHPDDRAMLESNDPQTRSPAPDVFEHEFRMRHTDGHWVWVLSRGRIEARDADGRPIRFVGVDIDISEQKRLEEEVRQSDAYLTSAMESNVAAFAIYDDQDILVYCNPEAERLLHLRPGLLLGRPTEGDFWTMETLDGDPLDYDEGPCSLARRAGALVSDIRFSIRWPDGRRQVLTCNATPVATGNGRHNTVVSFWDITEQLRATEQLREALAHAEAMSRSKSVFLANMSHEIRTPLNGVLGLAEVLSMQITDPEQSRMIATIRQSGETLLSVLNSILDMSKIEAGKIEIENVPLVLQDLLQQIDAVYSIQAEEKGLEFEVITSTGADLPRIGDPHRIQQILHNLMNNAIKFTSQGAVTLTVACRRDRPVVFEVRDTGVGMTPEQSARVFHSFEQADGSTTRRFGGTGLGLSIVRELVALMGGQITLDSAPGDGTCIRVELPLPMARAQEAATA